MFFKYLNDENNKSIIYYFLLLVRIKYIDNYSFVRVTYLNIQINEHMNTKTFTVGINYFMNVIHDGERCDYLHHECYS